MISYQMNEILENNPLLYNNNTSFTFWVILYVTLLIYPYKYLWYIQLLIIMLYVLLIIILVKIIRYYL
jgi:hypothetical protein